MHIEMNINEVLIKILLGSVVAQTMLGGLSSSCYHHHHQFIFRDVQNEQ